MTLEKFKCIDDAFTVPFFMTAVASVILFWLWLRHHYRLGSWRAVLVLLGSVNVWRDWKTIMLHGILLLAPMVVVIVSAQYHCGLS